MKPRLVKTLLGLALAAAVCLALLPAQEAEAAEPLSFSWGCSGTGNCFFTAITSAHTDFRWKLGDGTSSGRGPYYNYSHSYTLVPDVTIPQTFEVRLAGFLSPSDTTRDNRVICTITLYFDPAGGAPGTSGTCS